MKLRQSIRRLLSSNFATAIRIALIWTSIAILQAIYDLVILTNYDAVPDMSVFWLLLQSTGLMVFVAGILAGLFLIPRVNRWLRTHSYGMALLLLVLSTTVLFILMSTIGSFIYHAVDQQVSIFDPSLPSQVGEYLVGIDNVKNYFFWLIIAVITILGIQINDKYGPGIFYSFLMGKYFHPKEEDRIFMFLDIRSSTTIAEQLEEMQYFEFLKDFFKDATPGILKAKGEIYQYVGDEMVVSWPYQRGLENYNCINAFFEVQQIIQEKAAVYKEKYGIVPTFKVGIHGGKVISGEIGLIKRDIAFSGDILNTTARIQSKCNEMGVDLLLSETLYEQLSLPTSKFQILPMGNVDLKGKAHSHKLYTINLNA